MSFAAVLDYARTRMTSLGFTEHEDAFNAENIPRTKYDVTYHLEILPATRIGGDDYNCTEIQVPYVVRVYQRYFRTTNTDNTSRKNSLTVADTIVDDFIIAKNRLTTPDIKTVQFDSMVVEQLSEDNDNSAILNIQFSAKIIKNTGSVEE